MLKILDQVAGKISNATKLEDLARPVLAVLHSVTGMESAYLTSIDLERDIQHVVFASNTGSMVIPEGLEVPWNDTLCKRALEQKRLYTDNVEECWGDSTAAKALGIKTYLSSPVIAMDGRVLGTLCAASAAPHAQAPITIPVMKLFTNLLALFMDREDMLGKLREQNAKLEMLASNDALTELPNRRALMEHLERELANARRNDSHLFVSIIDLDNFKAINDEHGHNTGDLFLKAVGSRLKAALRSGDFLSRFGGDEFIVVSQPSPDFSRPLAEQEAALLKRLFESVAGDYQLDEVSLTYGGASVGVACIAPGDTTPGQAIHMADTRMYELKKMRRLAASFKAHQ